MHHEEFIEASAELDGDPQFKALFFHPDYVDKRDHPYFRFVRKAVGAHMRLQAAIRRSLKPDDPRAEVLRWASMHAEACRFFSELKEPDLVTPEMAFGLFEADGPEGWMALGLSALLLEMVLLHTGKLGEEQFWQFYSPLRARGRSFSLEREYALAEAGRLAKLCAGSGEERLQTAIKNFRVPGEAAWGEAFIMEAGDVLKGRIESRAEILHDAVVAIHTADGLPRDPWGYLKPHLDRHAQLLKDRFGFGRGWRTAVYLGLKILRV